MSTKFKEKSLSQIIKAARSTQVFRTKLGHSIVGDSSDVMRSLIDSGLKGRVQLVFTSPPFPLNRKKKYDNFQGDEFRKWLASFAPLLRECLAKDGSIVVEMGNAWEPGKPVMSTLALESLLELKRAANLFLCQEFVWHNPAKLPTPAQWVTVKRIRVKDSYTKIWWMSPTPNPKADNRRVLVPYSKHMKDLLRTRKYNAGKRPSEHVISSQSFLKDNGGAIPPNVISAVGEDVLPESFLSGANTHNSAEYQRYCREHNLSPHPARMPKELAEFFIKLCTEPRDIVLDPFGGSNTTGEAAETLDRRWLSIEINSEYAESGRSRFPADAIR